MEGGTSAHRTVKPSESSNGRYNSPTFRTPATLSEPLFTLTVRSINRTAAGTSAAAAATILRSSGESPACAVSDVTQARLEQSKRRRRGGMDAHT
jgi:hypothetical protein